MTNNLFVGGLPYAVTREELTELFAACGKVNNVKLIMDGLTGRTKGFGFVEMCTEAEAQAAIAKLNGTTFGERQLFISEARPLEKRPGGPPRKPGFVERRTGPKDRRRQQPGAAGSGWTREQLRPDGAKREGFGGAKKWTPGRDAAGRREGFGGAKKWTPGHDAAGGRKKRWGKPAGGTDKRKDFGGKKKWGGPRAHADRRPQRRSP